LLVGDVAGTVSISPAFKHGKKLEGENKTKILDDVEKLQLCEFEIVFRGASSLFLKK